MAERDADDIARLSNRVASLLLSKGLRVALAESCTGGWVAMALTAIPGSSEWFDRGYVTYSNLAKQQVLGVSETTLQRHGAVSEQTVAEMTSGTLTASGTDLALAISGIAGPGGGTTDKPVGTVCFAWQRKHLQPVTARRLFDGDREAVRRQAVVHALRGLIELVENG
jgi:nicotinamide-nucleotide amidase